MEYQNRAMDSIAASKKGIDYPLANMNVQKIALDVAEPGKQFDFDGEFVYLDRNSTGIVGVQFNNQAMPVFPFGRQTAVRGFPYKRLILSWQAQPGLVAYLWYGYGSEIVPPTGDINTIAGTVNVIEQGFSYGASFDDTTALGIGGTVNAFSAGANANGARLWSAEIMKTAGGQSFETLQSHTVAPVALNSGNIHAQAFFQNNTPLIGYMSRPRSIVAGRGVWNFNAVTADGAAVRNLKYTLL